MWKFMTYFSITPQIIIAEAKKLGFQTEILQANKNFYVIRGNWKEVYFKSNDFWWNTALWYKISDDKELTTIVLDKNWFKTPKSIYIWKKDLKYFDIDKTSLRFPLVTKPVDEWHWNWVTVWIETKEELKYSIKEALKYWKHFIIQEYIKWEEYRILVIWDKVILWIKRIPAHVIWDGIHTIKELIEEENKNPLRWKWYESSLTYIEIDKKLINFIWKKWLKLDTISKKWEHIKLRWISNLWAWWTSINITNEMSEELKKECIKAVKVLWLQVAWIDIITENLGISLQDSWWAIIEVNATPWFWWDFELTWVNTWKELLKYVFSIKD